MDEKQAIPCEKREEKTIATVFANFASSTSAHGLVHAVNAKSTITRLFWFAVLLAALSMFFFMLGLLIRDFNRKPVSTTIRIQQEKELKFPAVMVCNHNMLRKSAMSNSTRNAMWDQTKDNSIMSTYAATSQEGTQGNAGGTQGNAGGTQGTAGGTQATVNATADVDTDYVIKMNMLENLDNMDRKELEKTGHSFSSFVTYCNWKGMLCHKGNTGVTTGVICMATVMFLIKENHGMAVNSTRYLSVTLAQIMVKHFLQQNFGVPYDENFYVGDWMMGPNYFCWQPICYLGYNVNALGYYSKPKTTKDVTELLAKIESHNATVENYIKNMKMGVAAGMVRAKIDCKAGLDAFVETYKKIGATRKAESVLQEWFGVSFLASITLQFAAANNSVNQTWTAENGKSIKESVKQALIDGVGKPILKLINYLEFNHSIHCLPNDMSSGLGNLPVANIYVNGTPGEKTTQKMPLTGAKLDGKKAYKLILPYFTTSAITPEEINSEGERQLKLFYNETLTISKKIITDAKTTEEAVKKFKAKLNSDEMWHGETKFPVNESNSIAFKRCTDHKSAEKFCPVRWRSMKLWKEYVQKVMSIIYPKIVPLFHFFGEKNTVPNCPIQMWPHYNPSNGAQYFAKSDSLCSSYTRFGMPFFLEKYGPKYQEWSVTGHEARPGHHTQYQGIEEHFRDRCGGLPSWFDKQGSYTVFVEGWALYGENPLLSDDVNLYKDNLLQKYGMFKWQTWRAVRLIVDTGLHYRGKNMTWARKMFEDYTWDTGDFARKEIVRYMSDPGQATAYMLGRLELIKLRKKAEKDLGSKFDLKDFHYQVLSQGSSPIDYLKSHIDRYIECKKSASMPMCEYILTPVKTLKNDLKTSKNLAEAGPAKPVHRHFV